MEEKTRKSSGADEKTPSVPEYFSWINSTNEGSTEAQTLANLDYFCYMKERYGMQLGIYAWDAGNLDGSRGTYQTLDSPKIRAQYPNGYASIVKKADEAGIRMGLWGGADGFGETEEDAQKRQEQMISLCRDYHFGLFKFDTVCSDLRAEKRHYFVEMIQKCREYCPDLIVLNHRNDLGEAEIIATTFLWEGLETYTDINSSNPCTGMHNRVAPLRRGNVPELRRLTEDHGVCLSSSLDYFEDELIIQAFGRSLILAPELYGNPWFLTDWEQAHLARIFNLHRQNADILVNGLLLPEKSGYGSVSRGSDKKRFLVAAHSVWETRTVQFTLNEEIGLAHTDKVVLIQHHPYEKYLGTYRWGDTVEIPIMGFRSLLVEAAAPDAASWYLTGCTYEITTETDGKPTEIKLIASGGEIGLCGKTDSRFPMKTDTFDNTLKAPIKLGTLHPTSLDGNEEALYEAAMFAVDNDALEAQCIKRSGETAVPEIQAARDAFFAQKTYLYRGPEAKAVFDGKPDTFFDGGSKTIHRGARVNGGCLRLDLGKTVDADAVLIEYFSIDEAIPEVPLQSAPVLGTVSTDFSDWNSAPLATDTAIKTVKIPVVVADVHNIIERDGKRMRAVYQTNAPFRYFRLPCPPDRIFKISVLKNGADVTPAADTVHLNNLMSPYEAWIAKDCRAGRVTLPETMVDGSYLAVALEGETGDCGACVLIEANGVFYPCDRRAPAFPVNMWECPANRSARNQTHFVTLPHGLAGKTVTVHTLFNAPRPDTKCDVYFCMPNREIPGIGMTL